MNPLLYTMALYFGYMLAKSLLNKLVSMDCRMCVTWIDEQFVIHFSFSYEQNCVLFRNYSTRFKLTRSNSNMFYFLTTKCD